MKILYLLSLSFLFIGFNSLEAQNQLDDEGNRTGPWKGFYEDGTLRYEGTFLSGKPVGTMKRYSAEGHLIVEMNFYEGTDRCHATMFRPNGTKRATGIYDAQEKDSVWTYYGSDETIRLSESYRDGQLHGPSVSYYPSGTISSKTLFRNGLKEGAHLKFFGNGDTMLIANYRNNKLHGEYLTYHQDGINQISGRYVNDLKDGDWSYHDEEGVVQSVIYYDHGNVLNPEELEKNYENFIQRLEENAGNIPDPSDVQL